MKYILFFLLLAATATAQQPGPNVQFHSLFQIRAALPDTIELLHIGYNVTLRPDGVEVIKTSPPVGPPIRHTVPLWVEDPPGRWIAVTREGLTFTWDTTQAEPFFEIASQRQVLDMYVMAPPRLLWKEAPRN